MLALALNTSTTRGSLALSDNGAIIKTSSWQKEKSHSEHVTAAVSLLFENTGHTFPDLKLLVCGVGPGSFTGIRVGLSVMRTLAYAHGIPVIAHDDCFATALNTRGAETPVAVLFDAQQNKLFCALYEWQNELLVATQEPALVELGALSTLLKEKKYACVGDGFDLYSSFLPKDVVPKLSRAEKFVDFPRAEIILEYVCLHKNNFSEIDWKQVHPLYLRSSAAEEVLAKKVGKIDNAPRS